MTTKRFDTPELHPDLATWTDAEIGIEVACLLKELSLRSGNRNILILVENVEGQPDEGYTQFMASISAVDAEDARRKLEAMKHLKATFHNADSAAFHNLSKH